jgi:radical SAM superfamily enzyme YgiQ (UPF0313 family)
MNTSFEYPIRIGLAQISEQRYRHYYFPYSVGLLQTYAQKWAKNPERYRFLLPIFNRISLSDGIEALKETDIAGFSVYVWNINRSLAIAQSLKLTQPQVLIIFGGPQVPNQAESFLRQNPFIDLCVHAEGERTFLEILEAYPENDWSQIPGISYIDTFGNFHTHPTAARLKNIDDIPSPYLSGIFDQLMEAWPNREWIGTWETNRGCPFSCSFCDWGSLTQSKVFKFDLERLYAEIEWFGSRKIQDVFSGDANFGIFERDVELAKHFAKMRGKYGYPRSLQTQTAKNVKRRNFEIQKILAEAGLNTVTSLAVQSTNADVLKAINRQNISLETYREIQAFCLDNGIFSYTDIILGLPGETYDSFATTIDDVLRNGQYNKIIFYNASLLPNAEMAQPAYREKYGIESIQIHFPGHGEPPDGIYEYLEITVATNTLSREDWIRMHVFAWTTNFITYSHKMLQLPILLIHQITGVSYRQIIERFIQPEYLKKLPLLQAIQQTLYFTAQKLQAGYVRQNENPMLYSIDDGAHLAPEIALQLRLSQEHKITVFYREAHQLLWEFIQELEADFPRELLDESIGLSHSIFENLFYQQFMTGPPPMGHTLPTDLFLSYNLREFFQAMLEGRTITLEKYPIKKQFHAQG